MDILNVFKYHFHTSGVDTYLFLPPLVMLVISSCTSMGGVSGAFILLPFQMSVLHYTTPGVSATNFVYNIISIPGGVYRYIRDGKFSKVIFMALMVGTLPGVFLGYYIRIKYLPDPQKFKLFVGFVLIYLGTRTLLSAYSEIRPGNNRTNKFPPHKSGRITEEKFGMKSTVYFDNEPYSFSVVPIVLASLIVGVIGGAYGIGGGALMAPFLVSVIKLPVFIVSGASLCSTWVTSVVAALFYAFGPLTTVKANASPDWLLGSLFGFGGFLGIYIGARLQRVVPGVIIKIILGVTITGVALKYLWPLVDNIIMR